MPDSDANEANISKVVLAELAMTGGIVLARANYSECCLTPSPHCKLR